MMTRLRNTATQAVVKVSEEKADRLLRAGWELADASGTPTDASGSDDPRDASSTDPAAPSKAWKVEQLKAYAAEHDIPLGEAKKKDEILAVIEATIAEDTDDPDGSAGGDEPKGSGDPENPDGSAETE